MGVKAGAESLLHPKGLHISQHCINIPCDVVQALDGAICADAALDVASACFSTTAFVVSAMYLHK